MTAHIGLQGPPGTLSRGGTPPETDGLGRCPQPIQRSEVNAEITYFGAKIRLLGVSILLAALAPTLVAPLLDAKSAKPVDEFGSCFTQAEERGGRAWAYLPGEQGGTYTDFGARGVAASYWLQVHDAGPATRLRLFPADDGATPQRVIEAVEQCQ